MSVPYHEMLGPTVLPLRDVAVCVGCCKPIREIAVGCWIARDQSAQCPKGGWHKP